MKRFLLWIIVFSALSGRAKAQTSPFIETATVEEDVRRGISGLLPGFHQAAGVWSRSLGPRVTRPVLRGMDGSRLQIFEDGFEVSSTAADFSDIVSGASLLGRDNVEIVHGPRALRYGIGSVGGIVNILSPRAYDKNGFRGFFRFGGNAGPEVPADLTFGLQYRSKKSVSWLVGENRKFANYKIPRQAMSCDGAVDPKQSMVENSDYQSAGFALGSVIGFGTSFGEFSLIPSASMERYSYSVPVGCEGPDVQAWRVVPRLTLSWNPPKGPIRSLTNGVSLGKWSDHTTLAPDIPSTDVDRMVFAATNRTEVEFKSVNLGKARLDVSGGQSNTRTTSDLALGEEPRPYVRESNQAVFALVNLDLSDLAPSWLGPLEFAGRWESSAFRIDSQPTLNRSLRGNAISIGFADLGPQIDVSYTRSERIPSAYELYGFSNNLYEGLQERGNPQLGPEISHATEAGIELEGIALQKRVSVEARTYWYLFRKYAALQEQDFSSSGLALATFRSVEANFLGTETTAYFQGRDGLLRISFDLVRALDGPVREVWKKPPTRGILEYTFSRKVGSVTLEMAPRYELWLSPEVHLVSLAGSIEFLKHYFIDFELANGLNQTYVNTLSPRQGPLAEPGRTLRLGFRFDLGSY